MGTTKDHLLKERQSKSPVSEIILSREGADPSYSKISTFAEANSVLREWVDINPKGDGYGEVSICVTWKNSGWFRLRLLLEYPEPLRQIDIRKNIEYLIAFALGEAINPAWTPEENAKALLREKQTGASEHCQLVRDTCMVDDLRH